MESIDKVKGTFEKKMVEIGKNPVSIAVIKRLPPYGARSRAVEWMMEQYNGKDVL